MSSQQYPVPTWSNPAEESPPAQSADLALAAGNQAAIEAMGEGASEGIASEGVAEGGLSGFSDLIDHALGAAATLEIPNQDIVYEQLAHKFAYCGESMEDLLYLAAWGYRIDEGASNRHAQDGFGMTVFQPTDEALADRAGFERHLGRPLRPVIAFRGSDMESDHGSKRDLYEDWAENDLADEGVGVPQFRAHQDEIDATLGSLGGCDVVGHSLGGALAQLAACTFGGVSRICTYQSPGIPAEVAAMLGEDVESTHYRVKGDVVPLAGEALTSGDVVEFDRGPMHPGDAHTDYPLAELAERRDDPALIGIGGEGEGDFGRVTRRDSADVDHEGERVREQLGLVYRTAKELVLQLLDGVIDLETAETLACEAAAVFTELAHALPLCAGGLGWDEWAIEAAAAIGPVLAEWGVPDAIAAQIADAAARGVWELMLELGIVT